MQKNVTGQRFRVFAFDTTDGTPKTGDAAQITATIEKDYGASAATDDVSPTEEGGGYYDFTALQAETNADVIDLIGSSSTGNIEVIGVPGRIITTPINYPALGIETDGDLTKVNLLNGHTAQTADHTTGIAAIPTTAMRGTDSALTDKAGFSLSATGLDLIASTATGMVEIAKAIWDRVLTGGTHNIATSAGRRVRNIQDFGIYDMASAWVDEVGGSSTGTTDGEDATVANRANDFDNAQTVATSVGLDAIHIQNGNTITLSATINGFNLWSGPPNQHGLWTLVLAGQDIGLCAISGATVSGICTGTTPHFDNCDFNATTVPPCEIEDSSVTGMLTFGSAGAFRINRGRSGVTGAGSPTINMGAGIGASTLEITDWGRGLTLTNIEAGDVVTLDGHFGTITLSGSGGAVEIRGPYKALSVGGFSGTVNIGGAWIGSDIADTLDDTSTSGVVVGSINTDVIDALSINADAVTLIANGLLDLIDGVESGTTMREHMRLSAAALYGIAAGMATTTGTFRNRANDTTRISATQDVDGNRSAVVLDDT